MFIQHLNQGLWNFIYQFDNLGSLEAERAAAHTPWEMFATAAAVMFIAGLAFFFVLFSGDSQDFTATLTQAGPQVFIHRGDEEIQGLKWMGILNNDIITTEKGSEALLAF